MIKPPVVGELVYMEEDSRLRPGNLAQSVVHVGYEHIGGTRWNVDLTDGWCYVICRSVRWPDLWCLTLVNPVRRWMP